MTLIPLRATKSVRVIVCLFLAVALLMNTTSVIRATPLIYVVGSIAPQQVAQGATLTFQIKSSGLAPATFDYSLDPGYPTPQGTMKLDSTTGPFT